MLALALLFGCAASKGGRGEAAWPPAPGAAWQVQLGGEPDPSVEAEVYDFDLFDTSEAVFDALHQRGDRLVCYFSAGSYEDWREDADRYTDDLLGSPLDGWEGEWWVDIRSEALRDILALRLDRAVERGCDAVNPDNVNGYQNDNGLGLEPEDQLDFNRWLAEEAHVRGLAVGLKNDLGQIEALAPDFDFAVNEECHDYEECDLLAAFTGEGKGVVNLKYVDDWSEAEARAAQVCGRGPSLDTLVKTWDLGPERLACP